MKFTILSRESPETYRWLFDFLRTFLSESEVTSVWISNTSRIQPHNYNFAILYHSKTRGRINVTDVTDALYNEELEELSGTLGKRNVIVVIDDLDDNSAESKTGILTGQPSIGRLAQELFLFTPEAKHKTDTNQANIFNKQRLKAIIQAARPSPSLMNRRQTQICGGMMVDFRLTIIITSLMLFALVCWWYNVWILQW